MSRCAIAMTGSLLVALAAGCTLHRHSVLRPALLPPELPVIPRASAAPDVTALEPVKDQPLPSRPEKYRRLTTGECRDLAIRNAPLADDLDKAPSNTLPGHPKQARVGRMVRGYAADELRNHAASQALDEFYQLARAEGQFDLLVAAHKEVREQVTSAEEAIRQGLRERGDVAALRVQMYDLEAQIAELEAGIGALNASLRARLGLDQADPLPLWPDDPLRVLPVDVDTEAAVRLGLHYRPDLNLLRVLLGGEGSSETSQAVLAGINPLLAGSSTSPLLKLLLHFKGQSIQEQIASALAGRERQAEAEIHAAVATIHGHKAAAQAHLAAVRRMEAKVEEVEKRSRAGLQVTEELAKAKLDLSKAKGDLLKTASDWNIAAVKLRQAMGLLVRE